ncbi:hypothetical protein AOLI_G00160660 [Acnodon oligacanthus]
MISSERATILPARDLRVLLPGSGLSSRFLTRLLSRLPPAPRLAATALVWRAVAPGRATVLPLIHCPLWRSLPTRVVAVEGREFPWFPRPSCFKLRPPSTSDWTMAKTTEGLQLQALQAQPRPLLADSSFSLYTTHPAVPPGDARLFGPPLVSSALHAQILQGADVCLPSLLHPSAASGAPCTIDTGDVSHTFKSADACASKVLTTPEFTLAFSIYRDVICSAFPSRRQELDDYLSIILDLAVRFGESGFYEYHHLFSAGTSAHLQHWNISTYWGSRAVLPHFCRSDCTLL